jgi:hypothetical protein
MNTYAGMNELQNLLIKQTSKTPLIELNQLTGELLFYGRSIPENAGKIYEPVLDWVSKYITDARQTTNLIMNLEYFNTSSSLWLIRILKVLIQINNKEAVIIIHLYLSIEDYNEIEEFADIQDAFSPIAEFFYKAIPKIGIKIYGTDDYGKTLKDKLVFI